MNPHKTNHKCSLCNKQAWIISTKTNIPVYCRTCYNQLVNKCDELSIWCNKCGHKIPVCENHTICKKNKIKLLHVMDAGLLEIILKINKLLNSFLKT